MSKQSNETALWTTSPHQLFTNFRTEKSTQVAITIVWVSVGMICVPSLLLHETIPFPSISDVNKVSLKLSLGKTRSTVIFPNLVKWDEGLVLTNPTAK